MARIVVFVVLAQLFAASGFAQSLGDVARQEEARRKAGKAAGTGKVYTNDTLKPAPPVTVAPAATPTGETAASGVPAEPAAAAADGATAGAAASSAAANSAAGNTAAAARPAGGEAVKDEKAWRERMRGAREALERSQAFAEALQSRINALTTDFAARDDPFQRDRLGADRQKALTELDRVKKEIVDNTKAIADLTEEARRAGVPAGWLR